MTNITVGNHLSDDLIERYSLNQLPEDSVLEFEDHLLLCEGCQHRLTDAEQYLRIASTAAAELHRKPVESELRGFRLAWLWSVPKPMWAGALALLALTVGLRSFPESQVPTAPHEVVLSALRGVERNVSFTKPGSLILTFDGTEIASQPEYQVQVVGAGGDIVWQGKVTGERGMMHVPVSHPVSAGKYWVRLYGPNDASDLIREYGLEVK